MSDTITAQLSPRTRGQPITVKVDGASPGKSVTLTGTDENGNSFTIPVSIDSSGSGSATTTIPSNWGATLKVSGPGLRSYTGTVQGPAPSAGSAKRRPRTRPAKQPAKKKKKKKKKKATKAPARKPAKRSAAKSWKR